jgi:NhaA family Na+:H+ antiporter
VALPAGNALGIFGMTWLAVRLGIGRLPSGVTWSQVLGVGMLGGIGFTVAIFVSGIAFDDPALVDQAKLGVFGASLLAGVAGYLFLRFVGARASAPETTPRSGRWEG